MLPRVVEPVYTIRCVEDMLFRRMYEESVKIENENTLKVSNMDLMFDNKGVIENVRTFSEGSIQLIKYFVNGTSDQHWTIHPGFMNLLREQNCQGIKILSIEILEYCDHSKDEIFRELCNYLRDSKTIQFLHIYTRKSCATNTSHIMELAEAISQNRSLFGVFLKIFDREEEIDNFANVIKLNLKLCMVTLQSIEAKYRSKKTLYHASEFGSMHKHFDRIMRK
jgi:hypothetical protein